ncbi:hypothetical protein ACFY30_18250 [Streptomyces sp. NPDC000345]|uniref:hypothetical protein n=1 Tax=Streptomyces sp. NPDC000345 TaxID=3364537 RepID=UPI00369190BD
MARVVGLASSGAARTFLYGLWLITIAAVVEVILQLWLPVTEARHPILTAAL